MKESRFCLSKTFLADTPKSARNNSEPSITSYTIYKVTWLLVTYINLQFLYIVLLNMCARVLTSHARSIKISARLKHNCKIHNSQNKRSVTNTQISS